MGQQQLLLIVLGMIIVSIAVVVGIKMFTASAEQANRDAVILDLTTIAMSAQQYIRKPSELGGGGRSFNGFVIPTQIDTTLNGTYAVQVSPREMTLVGTGVELGKNGTSNVKVTMKISPGSIESTVINN